jgi:hypothetical protein
MRPELHFEQQVARLAVADARLALTREADHLAFADAGRNLHAERALFEDEVSVRIELGRAQRDLPRGAAEAVLQVELNARMVVVARIGWRAVRTAAAVVRPGCGPSRPMRPKISRRTG